MTTEHSHPPDADLDKTDELPILEGMQFDLDVADDAIPMDRSAVLLAPRMSAVAGLPSDYVRPSSIDLPSLAESVRSVEERISRRNAEYEALARAYEQTRDSEADLDRRAAALAADLAAVRTALESEQGRSRELDRAFADRGNSIETARSRVEEALREAERYQSESRTLRDSLATRDATIVQALHSLGERDAQLSALQAEHAKIVPALEATSKSRAQLDAELQEVRAQAETRAAELQASRAAAATLDQLLKRGESELNAARSELGAVKSQACGYLDLLRTREWRRGFDQNMFRELDAQVDAAHAGHGVLKAECARLQGRAAALEAELSTQAAAALSERARLTAELQIREQALAQALGRDSEGAQKVTELLEAAQLRQVEQTTQIAQLRGEQAAQIERLQADAETHEQEMAVLVAHLHEARRPIQSIEADVKRLTLELTAKSVAFTELEEEHRKLQATLERTRGALEEREFLIRRLERSESTNANVIGRIQTSIERLGSVPVGPSSGAPPVAAWSAELIRIDGENPVPYVLARRTRIGRAAGCELQIDSGSVSRHHALVLVGPREVIIEDLNSTNGVLVNGRKISRQVLSDGDALTIGEIQFRYLARPLTRSPDPNLVQSPPDT